MADFVASIQVSAGQTAWHAAEVPRLTADALYRVELEPEPMVTKGELRHFTSAELQNPSAAPRELSARELSDFARKCKAAKLPGMPEALPYSQWGAYLEIFNQDAQARGWWAGLIPPKDPHFAKKIAWAIAAEEHRKLLKAAIASGEIQARMAGTLVPAAPGMVNLQHLVLTREGLETFAARLAMQVVDRPHFVTSVRPLAVPPALQSLPDDARVSYEDNIGGSNGRGVGRAGEYRAEIEERIARQAEGHFTLYEAAQVLADSRPGLDPRKTVGRFLLAHSKGKLPIHQSGSRFPLDVGETVNEFSDTVEVGELDTWLRASVGYGFPMAEDASQPTHAVRPAVTAPDRGRRVKRAALIEDNLRRWPTIERDLKDAAANGLSVAARDGDAVGWWWEGSAVEWARTRAKVRDVAPAIAGTTGTIHSMRG